jgi:DNA-binding GntR family transcriptional regulator
MLTTTILLKDTTSAMPARNQSTLSASIVATLKERIIAWQYPPEHRLTEEALCREFQVSRSPVREALRVLATNGFVRRTASRGYAVRQVNLKELEELYEVRLALELYVIEVLAERGAPQAALAALREVWETVRREPTGRKDEDLAELDTAFHESLTALIDNETLLQQLRAINERLLVFRMIDFAKPDRVESTCLQHLEVLRRIADRDVTGARAAIKHNIDDGRIIVRTTLKEALARAYAMH